MVNKKYKERILNSKLNTYFVAIGDKDYNIEKEVIVPANPTCNCYSVAKAFVVTAIGILYDQGLLTPDSLLVDLLKSKITYDINPKWNNVTVHHLLLHKAGFGCGMLDIDCEDASLYPEVDYLKMVLETPLKYEPGSMHQYTDAAYYLLSRIIHEVSGKDVCELLRPILMDTMRFKELSWSVCPYGYSIGATGLYIRTEDMVKLGILYVNGGIWKGKRIISEEWVNLVISNGYEFKPLKEGWYGKGGMRGQLLMFNVNRGLAVGIHSYESGIPYELFIPEE